jgi:fructokinase
VVTFFRGQGLENLCSIGIASFGPLDLRSTSPTFGFITSTPKPGWQSTDIAGRLRAALNKPVAIDTDVNAAALAEGEYGAARGLRNFVYYTVGTGIGAGIVVDGRIVHGRSHPECGHIRIPRDPADAAFSGVCPYHADCLEGLASGPALQARVGEFAQTLPPDHSVWKLEARYLALAVVNTFYMLAPERIILGGGVMRQSALFPAIRNEVRKLFNGYVGVDQLDDFVVPPALGNDAGILGAILLAVVNGCS